MKMVLIVDDDAGTRETLGSVLQTNGFVVQAVSTGSDGVAAALENRPCLALVERQLPDMSGIEVVRALRDRGVAIPTVMVTGDASTSSAVEAMRVGARDYLVKPVNVDELVSLVHRLVPSRPKSMEQYTASHAADRWAIAVVRLIDCPHDARTIREWGRWVAAAPGTIRNWCRTAGLSPKRSLDFARVLRAVSRSSGDVPPQELLNVADLRTLDRLLNLGCSERSPRRALPADVGLFLKTQRWIMSTRALAQVERAVKKGAGRSVRDD